MLHNSSISKSDKLIQFLCYHKGVWYSDPLEEMCLCLLCHRINNLSLPFLSLNSFRFCHKILSLFLEFLFICNLWTVPLEAACNQLRESTCIISGRLMTPLWSRGGLQAIRGCFAESAAPYSIMLSSEKIEVMYQLALGETLCATRYFPWQFKADNCHYSLFSEAYCSLIWFKKTTNSAVWRYVYETVWLWESGEFQWQVTSNSCSLGWKCAEKGSPLPLQGFLQLGLPSCHIFSHVVCLACKLSPGRQHFQTGFLLANWPSFAEAILGTKCLWLEFLFCFCRQCFSV